MKCESVRSPAAASSASCTAAAVQLRRAEKGFAGATQNWTYRSLMQDKQFTALNLLGLTLLFYPYKVERRWEKLDPK